ncbi:hypothetical protein NBRC10513v2_006509, partial [Rhodotorula toruloides]
NGQARLVHRPSLRTPCPRQPLPWPCRRKRLRLLPRRARLRRQPRQHQLQRREPQHLQQGPGLELCVLGIALGPQDRHRPDQRSLHHPRSRPDVQGSAGGEPVRPRLRARELRALRHQHGQDELQRPHVVHQVPSAVHHEQVPRLWVGSERAQGPPRLVGRRHEQRAKQAQVHAHPCRWPEV